MDNRVLAARLVASDRQGQEARPDRLLIKDLVLPASIGVHSHEREAAQRVRINVELEVADEPRSLGDDIGNVVSYEHTVDRIKALVAAGHINLVETLAERIAEICLEDPRARRVRLRVEKLDVEPDAESVGIEIERPR